jgi:hypothetical protein
MKDKKTDLPGTWLARKMRPAKEELLDGAQVRTEELLVDAKQNLDQAGRNLRREGEKLVHASRVEMELAGADVEKRVDRQRKAIVKDIDQLLDGVWERILSIAMAGAILYGAKIVYTTRQLEETQLAPILLLACLGETFLTLLIWISLKLAGWGRESKPQQFGKLLKTNVFLILLAACCAVAILIMDLAAGAA